MLYFFKPFPPLQALTYLVDTNVEYSSGWSGQYMSIPAEKACTDKLLAGSFLKNPLEFSTTLNIYRSLFTPHYLRWNKISISERKKRGWFWSKSLLFCRHEIFAPVEINILRVAIARLMVKVIIHGTRTELQIIMEFSDKNKHFWTLIFGMIYPKNKSKKCLFISVFRTLNSNHWQRIRTQMKT